MKLPAAVGASAAGVTVGWQVANVGAVADTVAEGYGVSLAAVGLLTTAMFVTHLAVQLPGGRLIDRIGARKVAIGGITLIGLMNTMALITPELALGASARALLGLGTGLTFIAGSDYVRSMVGSPFAQGVYGGINLGMGGVALAVVPLFETTLEWRAPFATAAVLSLLSAAAFAAAPQDRDRGETGRWAETRPPFSALRPGGLFPLVAIHAASFGLNIVIANWIVVLLERAGDYSTRTAAAIGALTLLAGVITRPVGGWVIRRHPDRTRQLIALSMLTGGAATAALAWAGPVPLMVLAGIVVGLSAGFPFAAAFTGAARGRPTMPGTSVAYVNALASIVILAGTPLVGLTFALPGDGRIGFLIVGGLWALSIVALPSARLLGVERSPLSAERPTPTV
ncbi:MAG: MFS transporter [Gaiellaceae bacterium]